MDPIALTTALTGFIAAQDTGLAVSITALNKTNDVAKAEADALVQMLQDSLAQLNEHMLDIYA